MGDEKMVSAEEARERLDEAQCMHPNDAYHEYPVALRTVIALHARAEQAERERDEARSAPRPCPWCDGRIGVDGVSFHAPGCKVIEADALKAERDRLARAVLDANVSTGGSLYEIDFCPFCGGCLGGPDAGRVEIDGHSPGCVRGELEAADAAREVTRG